MGKTILCLVVGHIVEEEDGTFFDDCVTHPGARGGSLATCYTPHLTFLRVV